MMRFRANGLDLAVAYGIGDVALYDENYVVHDTFPTDLDQHWVNTENQPMSIKIEDRVIRSSSF